MPTFYRIEISPNRRAGCQGPACKKNKIKIQKDEPRFGTWVEIPNGETVNAGFKWRHWGCTTDKVIENVKKQTDGDPTMIDGFEDVGEEMQEKIKTALEEGHIAEEDRTKVEEDEPNDTEDAGSKDKENGASPNEDVESPTERTKATKVKKNVAVKTQDEEEDMETPAGPTKKRGRPKKQDTAAENPPASKKARTRGGGPADSKEADDEPAEPRKPGRPQKGEKSGKVGRPRKSDTTEKRASEQKIKSTKIQRDEVEDEDEEEVKPRKTKRFGRPKKADTMEKPVISQKRKDDEDHDDEEEEPATVKAAPKKRGRPKKAVAAEETTD